MTLLLCVPLCVDERYVNELYLEEGLCLMAWGSSASSRRQQQQQNRHTSRISACWMLDWRKAKMSGLVKLFRMTRTYPTACMMNSVPWEKSDGAYQHPDSQMSRWLVTAGSQPSVHVSMMRNVTLAARMFCRLTEDELDTSLRRQRRQWKWR